MKVKQSNYRYTLFQKSVLYVIVNHCLVIQLFQNLDGPLFAELSVMYIFLEDSFLLGKTVSYYTIVWVFTLYSIKYLKCRLTDGKISP